MLVTNVVHTVSNEERTIRPLRRGVPEGSPLSRTIFNVCIDILAREITRVARGVWATPLNLFADDVVLTVPSHIMVQQSLEACCRWAADNGFVWGLSKCDLIAADDAAKPPPTLASEVMGYTNNS